MCGLLKKKKRKKTTHTHLSRTDFMADWFWTCLGVFFPSTVEPFLREHEGCAASMNLTSDRNDGDFIAAQPPDLPRVDNDAAGLI